MQISTGKPKKTILVKVSSNEALNLNKPEMETRQIDVGELVNAGNTTLDKEKNKDQFT